MTNKCFTPLILAVDVGTTSIKAGVISADGRLDVLRQRPTVYHLAQPPAFEVDMDWLAAATVEVLKECVAVTEDASSIVAVAVTALGDGVWPLDRRHRPAAPALIWRDGRSNEVLRRWRREGRLAAVAELTGTYPTTAHQTTQMAWLKAHLPERVASVRHLFFAEDWIGFVLTGQVGVSIANFEHTYGHVRPPHHHFFRSAAQTLHILDLDWMQPLLPEPTSPLQPRGTLLPAVARHIGAKAGLPVFVGPFDVLAAALGAGAVLPTQASSIWGTAAIHQRWVTSFSPSEIGYLVSHPQQPGRWLRFVATSAGMVNLDYWRELLYPEIETGSQWTSLELALAQLPPGCDGLMYLPYLSAADERSEETPGVFGAGFLGVQAHHRRTHYLRAVYEGLAIQAARILRRLDPLDVPLQEVRVAGGGAQSDLLTQLLAHAAGLRAVRPHCTEASLLGVAGVAFTALGYATDLDALMQTFNPPQTLYTPDATVTSRYRTQAAAIDRLLRSLAEASPEQPESAANELA
ncbi:FGGY family carbohydrate kinase [Caldilinea sp.]|uniref:FGGY family carbohydrate kinase n=1 Tax=Caldilinea sp. TaxID=2293560 RepID=UPI002591208E|nr:FGGY family carbohydrate kinase [Caldilinea sp.]